MSTKKRGLGKGLSALISNEPIIEVDSLSKDIITDIDIDLIIPNKNQPRTQFHKEGLKELSKSIELHGLIQPILLREVGKKYEIIAGERRLRACKMAGLKTIPSIIKDFKESESAKLALIENVQREDLTPIEEAQAYKTLMDEFNLTQENLAREIGKSRSYIANTIRLLNLDGEVLDHISKGKLSQGHGKALLGIKNKKEQKKMAGKIINENLNVRDTEVIARQKNKLKEKKPSFQTKDPHIKDIEESLMMTLGTKVNLVEGSKKGRIEIEYYGDEDLERILELLIDNVPRETIDY